MAFPEHEAMLRSIAETMSQIATELGSRHPDAVIQVRFSTMSADVQRRVDEAVAALGDEEHENDYAAEFEAHGLTIGTTEWELKSRGTELSIERYQGATDWDDSEVDDDHPPPPRPQDLIRRDADGRSWRLGKKSLSRLFTKWANIILGSMGCVPGVPALEELKKALEAGLDEV